MYTSEIRETDLEGKPVTVSPSLLARVRETDEALREWLGTGFELEYTGRWTFPESEKAVLALQVRVPNEQETFSASIPLDRRGTDGFISRAVDTVLAQASKTISIRVRRQLHDLLVSAPTE
jgi:hypothetical protein